MSWSTSELRVRLAPLNRFKPSSKIFYWPFQGGTSFVDLLYFCSVLCLLCFVRVCLHVLCGHLLGKGWPLGSRLWCLLWVCHFPIGILGQVWYLIVSIPDLCTITYFYIGSGTWANESEVLNTSVRTGETESAISLSIRLFIISGPHTLPTWSDLRIEQTSSISKWIELRVLVGLLRVGTSFLVSSNKDWEWKIHYIILLYPLDCLLLGSDNAVVVCSLLRLYPSKLKKNHQSFVEILLSKIIWLAYVVVRYCTWSSL